MLSINKELNRKLDDRPTVDYIKKVLNAYEDRMEVFNNSLEASQEQLAQEQSQQDREIALLNKELTKCNDYIETKMDIEEGTKIWGQFDKYSQHEDLKELYKIVNPEIAKFEQKIIDFDREIEQFKRMIRQFDQNLLTKSNKHQIKMLYEHIEENYDEQHV